ncbi:MAG: phage tail tape measure protein [Marinagarivorans sp.]|nr:phage tail tape measure protein [Marinagarivorans sp.]
MQQSISRFTRSATRNIRAVNRASDGLASSLKSVAAYAAGAGFAVAALSASGASFEQAITDVGAVSMQTREQIAPLEQLALKLGSSTKYTATEAARAMETLARAGFSASETLSVTPAVLSGAAAAGMEIAEVAEHVSSVLKGMRRPAAEAAEIVDILALASAKTKSTIGTLGDSMSKVSSTAAGLKVPVVDAVAAVAMLQDVGLEASISGSGVNTMLNRMSAQTPAAAKAMKKLGITFKDSNGNLRPFADIFPELSSALGKLKGDTARVGVLVTIFGTEGQKAAQNLTELYASGRASELVEQLQNAKGSAEQMSKIRMNTTIGSLTLLGSAVDAVKVKIFSMQAGPLKKAIDRMTEWVTKNEDLIATNVGDFLVKVGNGIMFVVKHGETIGKIIASIIALAVAFKALGAVIAIVNIIMWANPIGLIVLAITAMIAAVALAIIWWDEIVESIKGFSNTALISLAALTGPMGWLASIPLLILKNWEPIKTFFADLWESITGVFSSAQNIPSLPFSNVPASFTQGDFNSYTQPTMISPQARMTEERSSVSSSEITIRDETKRASVTSGKLGAGVRLTPSGAF